MLNNRLYSWLVIGLTAGLIMRLSFEVEDLPPTTTLLFWIVLIAAVELLPVTLGFGSEVTLSFPLHLAVAIIFEPGVTMAITGISAIDIREFRGKIPLHRGLFNRAQLMLSAALSSALIHLYGGEIVSFPSGAAVIVAASAAQMISNLGLVSVSVATAEHLPLRKALKDLIPSPVSGFFVSYVLLSGLGSATAFVYLLLEDGGAWAVAAFLIPLVFARLSILGARAQQELAEQRRERQRLLLEASERVFQERELERHRIAEEIHDTSLQLLAAAAYGLGNAVEWLIANERGRAREAISTSRDAIEDAMKALRGSLVDLRKSTVEEGGLVETVRHYAEQTSVLWGTEIRTNGQLDVEPPTSVALAGFQILQEGLNNAVKHGQGAPITVTIGNQDGMIRLVVEDEGPGFDPEQEVGSDHVGMRLMKERAARVGGSIVLDSAPGRGTKLEAILPGGVEQ